MEALADRVLENGQYGLARDICADIIALHPSRATARLKLIRAQLGPRGSYEERAQRLNFERAVGLALDECELDQKAWLEASAVFERLGDIKAALCATHSAIAAGADLTAGTIRIAYLHYFARNMRRATKALENLSRQPDLEFHHVNSAIELAFKLGKSALAIAFARKQLALQPGALQHHVLLAIVLARASETKEALQLLLSRLPETLSTMPPYVLLEAAGVFNAAKMPTEELAVLTKAAERFPGHQRIADALKTATWSSQITQRRTGSVSGV